MQKRRWSELSPGQRAALSVLVAVEVALTTTALVDLARRPGTEVRGPKVAWALGCFVQPVGPIVYLALGRRASG
jgi:hypothetical protein